MEDIFGPTEDAPEYYIDSVRIAMGVYTITFELGIQHPSDTPASETPPIKRQALVRMSPQHALVMTRLLQKNMNLYQEKLGKINIPPDVYRSMDLEPE